MPAGATYNNIATTTLGASNTTITFSSIPQTYTDLRVIFTGTVTSATSQPYLITRINNDSSASYSQTMLYASNTSVTSTSYTLASAFSGIVNNTGGFQPTQYFYVDINVAYYRKLTLNKTILVRSNANYNQNGATIVELTGGMYHSTSAINQINLVCINQSWAAGTTATLYGITAA